MDIGDQMGRVERLGQFLYGMAQGDDGLHLFLLGGRDANGDWAGGGIAAVLSFHLFPFVLLVLTGENKPQKPCNSKGNLEDSYNLAEARRLKPSCKFSLYFLSRTRLVVLLWKTHLPVASKVLIGMRSLWRRLASRGRQSRRRSPLINFIASI